MYFQSSLVACVLLTKVRAKQSSITKNVATIFQPDKIWRLLGHCFLACQDYYLHGFSQNILFTGCPDHLALLDYVSSPQFEIFWTLQLLVMVSCNNILTSHCIHNPFVTNVYSKIFILPSLLRWANPPHAAEGLVTSLNKSDKRE